MSNKDAIGKVNITLKAIDNITGEIKEQRDVHNILTTTGLARVADLVIGDSSNAFEYIAIGEGTTTETIGDTTLETEQVRELSTVSQSPSGTSKWDHTFVFGSGTSFNITEVSVQDQASVGVMLNRSTFTAIPVDVDTDLIVSITVAWANCP